MNKQVRYGDQVYIEISNLLPPPVTDIRLLFSNGFLEEKVYGVKTQDYNKTNFRACVFTIMPCLVDSKGDLETLESLGAELAFLSVSKHDTVGQMYIQSEIQHKGEQIELSSQNIETLNKKIIEEMDNNNVCYGEMVLLQHLESGYYLCAEASCHPNNPNLYNLKLQKERSSACYFRFFSYSMSKDRGPIDYENEMKLMSVHLNTFVTMGEAKIHWDKFELTGADGEREDVEDPIFPIDSIRRPNPLFSFDVDCLVVGTASDLRDNNKIRLCEFCCKADLNLFNKRKVIKNGDYVRLQIDDFYLTASKRVYRQNFGLFSQQIEGYNYNYLNSIFQIIRASGEEEYPLGFEIQSSSKKMDNESDKDIYYIKHLATGQLLTIPEKGLFDSGNTGDNGDNTSHIPYFHLNNTHLKNQKDALTRNARISLQVFQNKDEKGHYYLESQVEKYTISQLDLNSPYFVGFKNSEDKIKDKLKLVKKYIEGNEIVGSFFKVSLVIDEEIRQILQIESYANALLRFMQVLQCIIHQNGKVTSSDFGDELSKILKYSDDLVRILMSESSQAQILAREFNILDITVRFLFYFLTSSDMGPVIRDSKFEVNEVIQFLKNLSKIILNATKNNEIAHSYLSQYVRVFISSLFNPSSLFSICDDSQSETLKDCVVFLLERFLWDRDLDTLGQLVFYEEVFFGCLDTHSDYSVHFLQVMAHYCKTKSPSLENKLRDNFISLYLSDDFRIKNIFPRLKSLKEQDDFEIEFERKSYPSVINFSEAPHEVQRYILWVFRLINSVSLTKSLKFSNLIIENYDELLCEDLVNSSKVPANIKNEVLTMLRSIHFAYHQLPFHGLPAKIQLLLKPEKLNLHIERYTRLIKDAENSLVGDLELGAVRKIRPESVLIQKASLQKLSFKLLREEFQKIQDGKLESLVFTLEVMRGLLETGTKITYESLYMIHHSLAYIIVKASEETLKKERLFYTHFIQNAEKIFSVLSQVDNHIVKLAFKEAITEIKSKVLRKATFFMKYDTHLTVASSSLAILEQETMNFILNSMSDEWKSKEKLYQMADKCSDMYTEERLMKAIWKIVQNEDAHLTKMVVHLVKNKTNFESNITKELYDCVLFDEEAEVSTFVKLASDLLNLNQIGRRLRVIEEFSLEEREGDATLDEIIKNLEDIFLTIYDYALHMKEDEQDLTEIEIKEVFLNRFYYSKTKATHEIPFEFKSSCVKTVYQRVLNALKAHEILIPYIKKLCFKNVFADVSQTKVKLALSLILVIIILYEYKNNINQNLLSVYNEFITGFYKTEILNSNIEIITALAELCRDNKKLLKMNEDHLFKSYAYTLLGYLKTFSLVEDSKTADTSLPIVYIKSLPILLSTEISKDMLDPAEIMQEKLFDAYHFLCKDNRISLKQVIKNIKKETSSAVTLKMIDVDLSKQNSEQVYVSMPNLYTIVKELLQSEATFVLTEVKERVQAIQSYFSLEQLLPFLHNENIEYNFELKKLTLQIIENLHFKNAHKNTHIFIDYKQFSSFTTSLLVDVYGFLKSNLDSSDPIFDAFMTHHFTTQQNKEAIKAYNQLLHTDIKNIVFMEYQSLVLFNKIWKEYICYIMCDFFSHLVSYFRDFMLMTRDKESETIFELWFHLILKFREINDEKAFDSRINSAMKTIIVHSEYATYRDTILKILGHETQIKPLNTFEIEGQKGRWKPNLEYLLTKYLGQKSKYKLNFSEANLHNIIKTLVFDRIALEKLVNVLKVPDMSTKDIIFIIKLFRRIIETSCHVETNKGFSIDSWTGVPYNELKKIHRHQDMLNDLNIVEGLFSLLNRHEKNKDVLKEILLLCIALLFGGNRAVQNSFYKHFCEDYENEVINGFANILEESLEAFRMREGERTRSAQLKTIKYIFDYLIFHPKSEISVDGNRVHVPAELKQELAQNYTTKNKERGAVLKLDYENLNLSLLILKFFQGLCEGHYLNFQEFLRDQTTAGHFRSYNIPDFLAQIYHVYHKEIRIENVEIGSQILALLAELEQGESQENIHLLLKKTFISDLCYTLNGFNNDLDLLARGFEFNSSHPQFMLIKSKALVILKDLVERSDATDMNKISQHIDLRSLICTFKENVIAFHKKKGAYPVKQLLIVEDIWDPNLSDAFMIYFILKHLSLDEPANSFTPQIQALLDEIVCNGQGISQKLAYRYLSQFFRQFTGSIEIVKKKTNRVMKIYFPISVLYCYLKQETKNLFSEKVDRSNLQTKNADLMDGSQDLIYQMYDEYKSRNSLLGLNYNSIYGWLRVLTNCLGLTVTIFNLFQLEYVNGSISYKNDESVSTQIGLNVTQACISFLLIVLWLQTRFRRYLSSQWDNYVRENIKEQGPLPQDILQKLDDGVTHEIALSILELKGPYSEEGSYIKDLVKKEIILQNIIFLLKSPHLTWHIIYFGICIFSSLHPLVTAFQLIDIVIRSDAVNRLAQAVGRNSKQFLWTLVLLFVSVYIYSFIGFYFLHSRYVTYDVGDLCKDGYSCLLASLDYGLRSGGGIGDILSKVAYDPNNKWTYFCHVLYDLTFFILIITLLLNLIFGMIIDAFGDLRDEKTRNDDDKLNVCFICGLSRSEYERIASFDKHIFEEHNMWQYLSYIVYLKEKNKAFATELTDVESYVLDRYNKKDYAWLPAGRSLSLERHFAKEEKGKKSEVAAFREEVIGVVQTVVEQNKQVITKLHELTGNADGSEAGKTLLRIKPASKKLEANSTIKSATTNN